MGIQRIRIDQQFAQIGVKTTPAKLNISMPKGTLKINNDVPKFNLDRQDPSFKVNFTKINSEMGLKAPLQLARDFSNAGKQAALQAAGQAKRDGNFLGSINKPPADKVPILAKNKANARLGPRQFNIGLMPKSPPEITWNKGHVKLDWEDKRLVIDYSGEYKPDISVDPAYSVEVFLRRKPYVRVMVEEVSSSAGRQFNSAI